jgi:hypothetical protein
MKWSQIEVILSHVSHYQITFFFSEFHIVVCGLDSIIARRWINGMLVSSTSTSWWNRFKIFVPNKDTQTGNTMELNCFGKLCQWATCYIHDIVYAAKGLTTSVRLPAIAGSALIHHNMVRAARHEVYVIYTYLWSIFAYYPNLGYRKRVFA